MRIRTGAIALVAGCLLGAQAVADKAQIHTGRGNVAVGGYDPVAYFTDQEPIKGNKAISHTYKGAIFRFSSEANKLAFVAAPDRYVPQYGGYCAWAVAQGKTAKGSPKHWKIVDGRLYLNYNRGIQKKWAKDIPGMIADANTNWPDVLKKK